MQGGTGALPPPCQELINTRQKKSSWQRSGGRVQERGGAVHPSRREMPRTAPPGPQPQLSGRKASCPMKV